MDQTNTHVPRNTREGAHDDGNKAIKAVLGMLSKAVATATAKFMVDTSYRLYPQTMRGDPLTPAATSLREYHFAILMNQVLASYAEGRGQDFADSRLALHHLLQEEPEHQPLADRFSRLMGLWLQEAHVKRRQDKLERQRRRTHELAEKKIREEQNKETKKAEKKRNTRANEPVRGKNGPTSPNADKQISDVGDEAQTPAPVRARDIFDLSGLVETDEDESSSDGESFSDEK